MKIALLEYSLNFGELLGDNILSDDNKIKFCKIKIAALTNEGLAKKILGGLRFHLMYQILIAQLVHLLSLIVFFICQ
jgi:hypothetical protein